METNNFDLMQAANILSLPEIIKELETAYIASTPGNWKKGITTHHTVNDYGYPIGEFRHSNDAQFVDVVHAFVPRIILELNKLNQIKQP